MSKHKGRLFIVVICIAIVIVAPVVLYFALQKHVQFIANFNEIDTSLPEQEWIKIEESIVSYASDHTDSEAAITSLMVRANSYSESSDTNGVLIAKFIVDIEEIEQNYEITYQYDKKDLKNNHLSINCPKYINNNYPNQKCIGMSNSYKSLDLYTPYNFEVNDISARLDYEKDKQFSLSIYSCGESNITNLATNTVNDYLKKVGLEPNDYIFNIVIMYNHCLIE